MQSSTTAPGSVRPTSSDGEWMFLNRTLSSEIARFVLDAGGDNVGGQVGVAACGGSSLYLDVASELHQLGIHTIRELVMTYASDRPFLERGVHRCILGGIAACEHQFGLVPLADGGVVPEVVLNALMQRISVSLVCGTNVTSVGSPVAELPDAAQLGCPTGCVVLDAHLGGHGWPSGMISCVAGEAGAGKTQLALQALVACVTSDWARGLHACYIVAEDVPTRRLHEFAQSAARRFSGAITADDILRRVLIRTVKCPDHLYSACAEISSLRANKRVAVGLVVLDSIAALVGDDMEDRSGRSLARIASELLRVGAGGGCANDACAVLVTNQVRFRPDATGLTGGGLGPALGLTWQSCVRVQLMLSKVVDNSGTDTGSLRSCTIVASPHMAPSSPFRLRVTSDGMFCTTTSSPS